LSKSRRPDFDLVLFDLDGTLMETSVELADAVNDTLREAGWPTVQQAQVDVWVGHGTRALLAQALAFVRDSTWQTERESPGFAALAQAFDVHYARRCGTNSRLYPHVAPVLQALTDLQVRLGVVTNKDARFAHALLQVHGVAACFDSVVGGDTLPVKKPDPAGIWHVMRHWKAAPDRTLFVGDSSVDVATARNAGVAVWVLPYGYNMGQPIEASQPDRVIGDFRALLPKIPRSVQVSA
jgi:phosphoglycolate phosphatase